MLFMFSTRSAFRPAAGHLTRGIGRRGRRARTLFDGDFNVDGLDFLPNVRGGPVAVAEPFGPNGCQAMKKAASKKETSEVPFGVRLRQVRMSQKISLRKFSEMVGVSPTYLSQVEQGHFVPPTADRVKKMAEILGEDPDQWIGMADRVPDDLEARVKQHPKDMPELMRLATGLTPAQFETLKDKIRQMKRKGK